MDVMTLKKYSSFLSKISLTLLSYHNKTRLFFLEDHFKSSLLELVLLSDCKFVNLGISVFLVRCFYCIPNILAHCRFLKKK